MSTTQTPCSTRRERRALQISLNLTFVLFNKAGEDLLGYPRGEMLGRNDYDFFPVDQADFFTTKDRSVFEAGGVLDIPREPIETRGLGDRWLHTKKVPIADDAGNPRYLLGISEDITELVETEDRLRIYEQFLVDAPIGLCLYEYEGPGVYRCQAINRVLAAINGRSVDEHLGHTLREIVPDLAPSLVAIWDSVMETGDTRHGEINGPDPKRPDETAWWLTSYCRLTGTNSSRQFIGGAVQDVTALKRAESNLRQALAENRDLTEFAFMASHDLKAPIRNIVHLADLIREEYEGEPLPGDVALYLDELEGNAHRGQAMIDGLLRLARIQTEGGDMTRAVDTNAVLAGVLHSLPGEIEASGAIVEHDPLPPVPADGAQLAQVFANLLSNGMKYSRPGVTPRLDISGHEEASRVVFAVTDNGMGIPRHQQDRLFAMFTRLHISGAPGEGIGLALVRRIIERHQGTISVQSQPNAGTTFTFALPANSDSGEATMSTVSSRAAGSNVPPWQQPGGTEGAPVEFARMPPRVMLVSDALMMPPEEGVRRTAHELAARLETATVFQAIGPPGAAPGHLPLYANKLPGPGVLGAVARFRPERLVFVPYHGMTTAGWVRLLLLAGAAPRARIVVLHAQPIPQTSWMARTAARLLRRRLVFLAVSPECAETARQLAVRVESATLGVDTDKFSPVSDEERRSLRAEHGFDADSPVVLHVGHPTPGRELDRIADLANEDLEVVLVLSGETEWGEESVVPRRHGVTVLTGYRPDLQDLYRCADVYVFAVDDIAVDARLNARAAIGTPLSVLEALACGTPVVTTRFGALTDLLAGRRDVVFVDRCEDFAPAVRKLAGTRGTGDVPGWDKLIDKVLHS